MEAPKIRSTSKYPTTLIVKGLNPLGIEIAKRLIEQEGYVIIVDSISESSIEYLDEIKNKSLLTVLDMAAISNIENDLRRLDYVYYFEHDTSNFIKEISTQEFLQKSNYLDKVLDISVKFKAKFLLTTSIKAHQLLIENSSVDINKEFEPIPKYSETEAQRYAENLVVEYQTKADLDSRIIRVGEVLGKGMNPSTDSMYMNLITKAVDGKPLEIQGDGLESDFYIHYIDVARGLIHAMFSMNTKNKIYSLAIPEEISILSIAYKIADIEPSSGEIKFVEYDSPLPPLRLYKPAPNLNTTGWNHKININRAISQSIEHIKEISKEDTISEVDESRGQFEDKSPESKNVHGALARLIAERKKQEKSRIGSVVVANEELRNKMKGDENIKKKVSTMSFWIFESLKKQFSFLKNITIKEFIFSMILIFIFGLIYIFLISPILNIGTNIYYLNNSLSDIESTISQENFEKISEQLNNSTNYVENIQNRFADLNFIFSLTGQLDNYSKIQGSLEIQKDYLEGMHITYDSLTPLYTYLNSKNYELIPKLSDEESLLDVEVINDQTYISEIANNEGSLKLGVEKLKLSNLNIEESLSIYPENIKMLFQDKADILQSQVNQLLKLEENYSYIPTLLGQERKINYLYIIQDSSRFSPSGGEFAGYIYFSIENGLITNIEVNSIEKVENNPLNLKSIELTETNLISTKNITNENINITDLTYLKDKDLRSVIIKEYFEKIFADNIDVVAWSNTNNLNELLENREITLNEKLITQNNFINSISEISGDEASIQRRNKVIMQIYSEVLVDANINLTIVELLSQLRPSITSNNLAFYTNDLQLKSFFRQFEKESIEDYIEFGMTSNGVPTDTTPKLTITGDVTVNNNGATTKSLRLEPNGVNNIDSLWICLPSGSKDFEVQGFNTDLYSRNFSSDQVCNIYLPDDNGTYPLTFDTLSFENNQDSIYNYTLMLLKPRGINAEYEFRFIFETTKSISSEMDPTIARINDFTFSSNNFNENIIFNFFEDGQ